MCYGKLNTHLFSSLDKRELHSHGYIQPFLTGIVTPASKFTLLSKWNEKWIFSTGLRGKYTHMPRHISGHSKETDYIVVLVQSTSGLVFSLASLWWIRKECLLRFLLSLWCFQVIVHTSHPFTLVAPSGMSLTILFTLSHWKWWRFHCLWLVWFVISLLQLREARFSLYHSHNPDRQMEPLWCHYLTGNVLCCIPRSFRWHDWKTVVIFKRIRVLWPRGYTVTGSEITVCCPFFAVDHHWWLGAVVPRPCHRKWCLLTPCCYVHLICAAQGFLLSVPCSPCSLISLDSLYFIRPFSQKYYSVMKKPINHVLHRTQNLECGNSDLYAFWQIITYLENYSSVLVKTGFIIIVSWHRNVYFRIVCYCSLLSQCMSKPHAYVGISLSLKSHPIAL